MDTSSDPLTALRRLRAVCPLLDPQNHEITSEPSRTYNCAAWAVHDTLALWWPLPLADAPEYYWPDGARRDDTLESFIDGYGRLDPPFEVCARSEEHTSELQSLRQLVCRLL